MVVGEYKKIKLLLAPMWCQKVAYLEPLVGSEPRSAAGARVVHVLARVHAQRHEEARAAATHTHRIRLSSF